MKTIKIQGNKIITLNRYIEWLKEKSKSKNKNKKIGVKYGSDYILLIVPVTEFRQAIIKERFGYSTPLRKVNIMICPDFFDPDFKATYITISTLPHLLEPVHYRTWNELYQFLYTFIMESEKDYKECLAYDLLI